ncbi:MGMT family protein [Mucilaginibacter paludis]|uniref:Uncharacterized protein n=1 Tax=Mucilaginibacter paludis DSM 18603 TaxID=714943 RepID=H1YBC0_9SPHI|nr:MGMT family protein [Mucilaginibacter paludis]EHQ31174.1 hypothetical protein Mucpa_7131 [Mucilaginibacter paludis DSM 18603]
MMKYITGKSWREKREKPIQPKVIDIPDLWARKMGHGKMFIPTPMLIDEIIKRIPIGRVTTVNIIRNHLASEYHADMTCPLSTGIDLCIAAQAAEEDRLNGESEITPYWRVLKEDGKLNAKFPGGKQQQAEYLRAEGFEIIENEVDYSLSVKNYKNRLINLSYRLFADSYNLI